MAGELSPSARRVQEALQALGLDLQVVELPASTRTAAEAAAAIGCQIGQIAKSLVFRGITSGRPILVIASGPNRVDEFRMGEVVGEPIVKANADYIRQHTGYGIGGVPPIGHARPVETYLDRDLLQHDEIWAAAGTPHAVFRLTPEQLQAMTGGRLLSLG